MNFLGFKFGQSKEAKTMQSAPRSVSSGYDSQSSQLKAYSGNQISRDYDGEKFEGGFGATQLFSLDYWTLRKRSSQLFTENLYAKGLVRRLITNEINTGITPEACPDDETLGQTEDFLNNWSETAETRFEFWAKNPQLCDYKGAKTFGSIQRAARLEALVSGDVLVVLHQDPITNLPKIQLVRGENVRTPFGQNSAPASGNRIDHGVETNKLGRAVAYWIVQNDGSFKRLRAYGAKSGRRISWLQFGCENRLDEGRGQPLLAVVLQSLKEIDRYRDSTQRKAVVNSILAMFIQKDVDKMGTLPMTNGAVRKGSVTASDATTEAVTDRHVNVAGMQPGLIAEELQVGEKPVLLGGQGTDQAFGDFESAVLASIAWVNEIPPEILILSFTNNYSASQAAINEFKIYLNKIWGDFGETFCTPIYKEWLISELLMKKIRAPGLLEAWRDPSQYDILGAWLSVDWYGSIKPSTDMLKQVKGANLLCAGGYSTKARESRNMTGSKHSKNMKRMKRENELFVKAKQPLADFYEKYPNMQASADSILDEVPDNVVEAIEEIVLNKED